MRTFIIAAACWTAAIVLTLALSIVAAIFDAMPALYLVTVVWAIAGWQRLKLWQYQNGLSKESTTLVILLVVFGWPLFMPWYLAMRFKILAGVARRWDGAIPRDFWHSRSGLVQPWKHTKL